MDETCEMPPSESSTEIWKMPLILPRRAAGPTTNPERPKMSTTLRILVFLSQLPLLAWP